MITTKIVWKIFILNWGCTINFDGNHPIIGFRWSNFPRDLICTQFSVNFTAKFRINHQCLFSKTTKIHCKPRNFFLSENVFKCRSGLYSYSMIFIERHYYIYVILMGVLGAKTSSIMYQFFDLVMN